RAHFPTAATSLSRQGVRRRARRSRGSSARLYATRAAQSKSALEAETPQQHGAPLESRTHPLLAQPRPALADPLGKESRELPGLLASSIHHCHATNCRGSRIGSKVRTLRRFASLGLYGIQSRTYQIVLRGSRFFFGERPACCWRSGLINRLRDRHNA